MATHASILAWRIFMDRGAWWATVHGVAELDVTEHLSTAQLSVYVSIPISQFIPPLLYPLVTISLKVFSHTFYSYGNSR